MNYIGLSPLHQAIMNEDPSMVSFLLQQGANINQRCYGASFCPDDQKSSRTDSLEHEYVELSLKTCYSGLVNIISGNADISFQKMLLSSFHNHLKLMNKYDHRLLGKTYAKK